MMIFIDASELEPGILTEDGIRCHLHSAKGLAVSLRRVAEKLENFADQERAGAEW